MWVILLGSIQESRHRAAEKMGENVHGIKIARIALGEKRTPRGRINWYLFSLSNILEPFS